MTTSKRAVVGWWAAPALGSVAHLVRDPQAVFPAYCGEDMPVGSGLVSAGYAREVCPVCMSIQRHLMYDHGGLILRVPGATADAPVREVVLCIDGGEQSPPAAPPPAPSNTAAVNLYDLGSLLHCALGYALGRQTYMVSVVQKLVRTHWTDLLDADRETLTTNLRRDLEAYDRHHRLAGDMSDHASWRALLKWCQEQQATGR